MCLPIIKIKHPDGYCLINESDFDPKIHQMFFREACPLTGINPPLRGEKPTVKKINLNTATKTALMSLSGVGVKTATEIIEARPFESIENAIAQFGILEGCALDLEV